MTLPNTLLYLSAVSFLFFGLGCFLAPRMKIEFIRYGLGSYRKPVGILQLIGALGLLYGYYQMPLVTLIAAIGLAMLMVLGFLVRIKIKDSPLQSFPALFYAVLNFYIAYLFW